MGGWYGLCEWITSNTISLKSKFGFLFIDLHIFSCPVNACSQKIVDIIFLFLILHIYCTYMKILTFKEDVTQGFLQQFGLKIL